MTNLDTFWPTLELKNFERPMTSKLHKNNKGNEIAGNLSSYFIRNTLTVCIMHQLDVLAKLSFLLLLLLLNNYIFMFS